MKHIVFLISLSIIACSSFAQSKDSLYQSFKTPPDYTKPWVYWYWISDHISSEGISKDLEAMAKVGIGEALIGNIDQIDEKGKVKALTEDWYQMVEHAIREGKRTGVNIGLFNSPGWSQSGGPWITPEQTMRYLTHSEIRIKGPKKIADKLEKPSEQFQDVALIAFKEPAKDTDNISRFSKKIYTNPSLNDVSAWFDNNSNSELFIPTSSANSFILDFETSSNYTVRSLTILPAKTSFRAECELQRINKNGTVETIKTFQIERTNNSTSVGFIPYGAICETFAATSSKHFRLVFSKIAGNAGFAEIVLSGAARTERFIEKQLAKLWPTPAPLWDAYLWKFPAEVNDPLLTINPKNVQNITRYLNKDGVLEWNVPEGDWIIQRIGMTPTGQKNAPASIEATGLEVDKMNSGWVANHYDEYIGKIIKRISSSEKTALKHVVADSYETGAQNWTDNLEIEFQKHYGYNPIPYLPVLFGRVTGSAELSERFLWDLRRLIADKISMDYVGTLRKKSNADGLNLWLENYGHWGYPGEFLQYGGQSDEISGEFWTGDEPEGLELRAASSASHIYAKNIVSAEAFTSGGPMWTFEPWSLKMRGDWAATKGINHFVLHVYIHQPYSDKIPGINAWFGIEYNRFNTWFFQSKEWIDYLRRTHYLLQQGHYVADVAYFIGEDAPKMTGIRDPFLPDGYNFDYINADVILNRLDVKNGQFILPDGMTYKILVLPPQTTMRPILLKKIKQLIAAGGIVVGMAPEKSPSLENYPLCDKEIETLSKEIWQNCDGKTIKKVSFGKGIVYSGMSLDSIFDDLKIVSDLSNSSAKKINWIHRSAPGAEIYYLSNQSDEYLQCSPSFRIINKQPELWDPVSQEMKELPDFSISDNQTVVPLEFAPRQSYFILFRKNVLNHNENVNNFKRKETIGQFNDSWNVTFVDLFGNRKAIVFDSLLDWTQHTDKQIRYFSGTAIYSKKIILPETLPKGNIYLSLGGVNNIAMVKVNNKDVGALWAEPYRIEISGFLIQGENQIEIELTNTWNNRLVAEAALDQEQRQVYATAYPSVSSPLLPSGLLGPVLLEIDDEVPFAQKVQIYSNKDILLLPGKAAITMTCPTKDVVIHYTLDGSEPTEKSVVYSQPFEVDTYSVISAKAFHNKLNSSEISTLEIDAYDPGINGFSFAYFEGDFSSIPDFSTIKPVKTGITTTLNPSTLKLREDHFALLFNSVIEIPATGNYTFTMISDDGSKLYIDDKLIVDNDGCHGDIEKSGSIKLSEGKHKLRVEYFENINGETLRLSYNCSTIKRKAIPLRWLLQK